VTSPNPPWSTRSTDGVPAPGSPLDRKFAAFIGPRWEKYREKFAPFYEDGHFQPTWNWSAALASIPWPLWFVYRRMYFPALLFWMLPSVAIGLLWSGDKIAMQDLLANPPSAATKDFELVVGGVMLSTVILSGGTANYLLYRRARAAMRAAEQRGEGAEGTLQWLERIGRTNLLAVAIVVVMLGLLGLTASSGGK
jgi:hypothetical protein